MMLSVRPPIHIGRERKTILDGYSSASIIIRGAAMCESSCTEVS
jgi:hypothetical protein